MIPNVIRNVEIGNREEADRERRLKMQGWRVKKQSNRN